MDDVLRFQEINVDPASHKIIVAIAAIPINKFAGGKDLFKYPPSVEVGDEELGFPVIVW